MAKARQRGKSEDGKSPTGVEPGRKPEGVESLRVNGFWSWMGSSWAFFGKVLNALKNDLRLAVLWGFGVLLLIALIAILVLGNLSPAMQLTAILSILVVIAFLFVYTVPRLPQLSQTQSVIEQVRADLNSTEAARRKRAVDTLKQSNDPSARQVLAEAVAHPLRDVRMQAAFALAHLNDERAVQGLIETLRDEEKPNRDDAAAALVKIGESSRPGLLEALGSNDASLRATVAGILGKIGGVDVVRSLVGVLGDNEQSVKLAAIDALKQLRDIAAVPELLKQLDDDKKKNICEAVIDALGAIGDDGALPGLLELLHDKDQDPVMRIAAVKALGQIGNPGVVSGLVEVLDDEAGDSRLYREKPLRGFNKYGHTHGKIIYNSVRAEVARALGQIGNPAAVQSLIKALHSKTCHHVRVAAAAALGKIRDTTAVPELSTILMNEHEDKELRSTTRAALNCFNTPEAKAAVAKIPITELMEEV